MDGHELWIWGGFLAIVLVLLAFDLGILHRHVKEITYRNALKTIIFYIILAICFGAGIFYFMGTRSGTEFATGYLIEMTLSIDNLFVFVLIFNHFSVPKQYQYRVLFWGVLVAIVLRFVFILAGTGLIKEFDWILYIFGAFLLYTGAKMLTHSDEEPDIENNFIINFCKRNFKVTPDYVGHKFFIRENGKLLLTPLFIVLMVINFIDIVFAFDSIPAIFAITLDPFIVFSSNIFAILGLRSMYFVMAKIVERFSYLRYGLALVLILIGLKMIINHYFHEDIISTSASLGLTVIIIAFSIAYSLYKTKKQS